MPDGPAPTISTLLGRIVRQEERVLHFARRVTGREIQRGEIVEIVFNVRTLGHTETHTGKNLYDPVERYRYRVARAQGKRLSKNSRRMWARQFIRLMAPIFLSRVSYTL